MICVDPQRARRLAPSSVPQHTARAGLYPELYARPPSAGLEPTMPARRSLAVPVGAVALGLASLASLAAPTRVGAQGAQLPPPIEVRVPKPPTLATGDGGTA